jgi:8-amino-7-oxononanoate synthase
MVKPAILLMTHSPYAWIDRALASIHKAGWYRHVRALEGCAGAVMHADGRSLINFASNDYLGLAGDDRLIGTAIAAAKTYGTGSTGSRLLSGHRSLHRDLEAAIAALKHTEDAIVFSSGYLANLGTIAALVGKRDLILSDRYNHSSLKQGALLSGATILDYPHNDVADLARQLAQHRSHYRHGLILTDSVFSMDGDLCPLPDLLDLADAFDCMLLVDEAHATGVLGSNGAGCVDYFGCRDRPSIQMGTLSKALGSLGGYVAGSAAVIDFLRNRASTWIYTTGLSPADTAAALEAVRLVAREPDRRDRLWRNVRLFQDLLAQHKPAIEHLPSASPIFCFPTDNPTAVVAAGEQLKAAGLLVSAVRPPTVPTSRLRVTLMATHTPSQIEQLVEGLARVL